MLSSARVTANRIVFVPGKNPKPPAAEHRTQLLRYLVHGIERADPQAARQLAAQSECFLLVSWNALYYGVEKSLGPDRPWIDALLARAGPTEDEVREALSWRRKAARVMVSVADLLPFLIPLLPDPAVKSAIRETARYFKNFGGIGGRVRERLKALLREMLARGERRYPGNIRQWLNAAAEGDLTALDPTIADDFAAMRTYGQIEKLADIYFLLNSYGLPSFS